MPGVSNKHLRSIFHQKKIVFLLKKKSLLVEKRGLLPKIDFFVLGSGFTFQKGLYYIH